MLPEPSKKQIVCGYDLEFHVLILLSDRQAFCDAAEHIQQILDIVKDLIDSGHAYVAKNGDVYFRVKSDPSYGKLSHLKLDDLESGNRELRSQMDGYAVLRHGYRGEGCRGGEGGGTHEALPAHRHHGG